MSPAKQASVLVAMKSLSRRVLTPGQRISQRVVHGVAWTISFRIVSRLAGVIRMFLLARLLAPRDFGLLGIALLIMSTLESLSQTGFQQALVHRKGDVKPYLDTAWTIQVARGLALALVIYGLSSPIAAFFKEPAAIPFIRVLALSMLFHGFSNIGVMYFQKEMEFHKQFAYQIGGTLVDLIVAVVAALLLRNTWALVFGLLAGQFIQMIISYMVHPYRPALRFEREKAAELYRFGRWVFAATILLFLITHGDDLFVGRVLGATALGFYQMAYRIANLATTEITQVVGQVAFPAYSAMQDSAERLRQAHFRVLRSVSFVTLPLTALIAVLAPQIVRLFLGSQWVPLIPALRVLTVYGAIRSLGSVNGSLFTGSGNPRYDAFLAGIKLICLAAIIYPLTMRWGITGTALATTLPLVISQSLGTFRSLTILQCRLGDYLQVVKNPLLGSVLILAVAFLVQALFTSDWIILFLCSFIGTAVYLLFLYVTGRLHAQDDILGDLLGRVKDSFSCEY